MNMETFKGGAGRVTILVLIGLWLFGLGHILAGIVAGTLLVLGLMMTIERIPGFWAFTCTGMGTVIVIIGTAYLSHMMFGTDSVLGMVALCWSLVFKVMVIDGEKRKRGLKVSR